LPEWLNFLPSLGIDTPKEMLLVFAVSLVVLTLLTAVTSFINKFYLSSSGERIIADIRERIFAHLQRLSLTFHDDSRRGSLIYSLTSDIDRLKTIIIDLPQDLTHRGVTVAVYIGLMLALDWRLGLIGLASLPFVALAVRYFGSRVRKAMKKRRKMEAEIASIIAENIPALMLVQAYSQEEQESQRFKVENIASMEAKIRALSLMQSYGRVMDFLVFTSMAIILYFGGKMALGGGLLVGTLVLSLNYLQEVHGALQKFYRMFDKVIRAQVSAERLNELVREDMVIRDAPNAVVAPPLKGRIEFQNVSFAYHNGKEAIRDVSFVVEAGETLALIGPSGAGKSTLISLLLRFYDPQQGHILVDRQDIQRFTLRSYREQITVLMQEARLFNQTVRENILFGRPDASEEEVIQAARLAQAHEFILQMPRGYDTVIQEGGTNLSGGQIQRINIARAILRNTPIVILDEPATGLDPEVEMAVNQAIANLVKGKTAIIIAHKFLTIRNADKILLLHHGQRQAFGTHEELLKTSPAYQSFIRTQFAWREKLITREN
ncbi:MAG: ABC transporter ATP-binding protein, partial [Calditrichaeota bacterium]